MGQIPPWPPITPLTLVGGAGLRHDSAALCDDDRVIYVYCTGGNTLYQSHYSTIEAFEKAANSSATTPVEFAATLDPTLLVPRATVWREPGGGLYLFVGGRTTTPSAIGLVFVSPSGNGESAPGVPDWSLHGTFVGPVTGSTFGDPLFFAHYIGEPYVTGGRWVLPAFYPISWDANMEGVYTSDDGGVTWTARFWFGFYVFSALGYGQGRNIVSHAGALWMAGNGNVEGPKGGYSTDGGTTWTPYSAVGGDNSGGANPITANGGTAWRIGPPTITGTSAPVLEVGTDYAGSGWASVVSLASMNGATFNGAILQHLAPGHDVFIWDGHIIVGRGGWGIGQVKVA